MLTPLGYFDLIDAMKEESCPVCFLLKRDASKLLRTILYESVTEPETHAIFRESFGLCSVHGWQMAEQGNVMSIAVLYSAVVDEALKRTRKHQTLSSKRLKDMLNLTSKHTLHHAVKANAPCPVCQRIDENQARYLSVFADKLTDTRFITAFETSDGLCLSHFQQVVALKSTDTFVEIQRSKWQALHDDMQEFIRKYDPTEVDHTMGKEGNSWLRTIRKLVGERGVFGRRPDEA